MADASLKEFVASKLKKLFGYLFSLKFYAGITATWLLCAGKISDTVWLAVMGMVLASRQVQHLAGRRDGPRRVEAKKRTVLTDNREGVRE